VNFELAQHAAIPLPGLPSFVGDGGRQTVLLRPFGVDQADLAHDFGVPDRARLITGIFESCSQGGGMPEPGFFEGLSVGKRIECLIRLACEGGAQALSLPFDCGGCGQRMELEFTVDELAALQSEADGVEEIPVAIGDETLKFRRPNALDQHRWSQSGDLSGGDAVREMIGTLAAAPFEKEALDDNVIGLIEEALGDADPLVDFTCRTRCGDCGAEAVVEADLTETALGLLRAKQQQLIYTVHRLAMHYHWNERDVFAVPHWRRLRYLELIDATVKR
jgi:hypothetical protein